MPPSTKKGAKIEEVPVLESGEFVTSFFLICRKKPPFSRRAGTIDQD